LREEWINSGRTSAKGEKIESIRDEQMKNTLGGINSRLEDAKERISSLEE